MPQVTLRIDGRPVVIVNNLPWYWWEYGVDGTNALFAEMKERYGLYLIGGVWPDTIPDDVRAAVRCPDDLGQPLVEQNGHDLIYAYAEYADAAGYQPVA
jgi:hypothetical protein